MSERSPGAGAPLDAGAIRAAMGEQAALLKGLELVSETGSTNADLLARPPGRAHAQALLADCQTGGRGRRGRQWFSPPGRNLYLSLGWRFDQGLLEPGLLPLAVAVGVARALARVGLREHGIKWPNDLVRPEGKLGGCLVELRGNPRRDCLAVLGVGLNVHLRGAPGVEVIDQAWTDLGTHCPAVTRNAVAGAVLAELPVALAELAHHGFPSFHDDWRRFDVLRDQPVMVRGEGADAYGTARGIGPRGGLLLERDGAREEVLAGDASVRKMDTP